MKLSISPLSSIGFYFTSCLFDMFLSFRLILYSVELAFSPREELCTNYAHCFYDISVDRAKVCVCACMCAHVCIYICLGYRFFILI